MPRDSSGNASVNRALAVTGQTVLAEQVNVPFADIQSMLNLVLWRDGISPWTGTQNANGFRISNVGTGTSDGDAVNFSQLSDKLSKSSNVGLSFGSTYASSASTLTRHISLYGTTYGFSVTDSSQNYVSASAHSFYSGSTLTFSISGTGVAKSLGDIQANNAVFSTDGNATGTIWAAWGSSNAFSAISSRIESRSFERARDFISTSNAGETGTYAFLRKTTTGNANPNDLVNGSDLEWSNASGGTTGVSVGSGVWKCMGLSAGGSASPACVTLYKRQS